MQVPYKRKLLGDMTGVAVNIPVDTTGVAMPSSGDGYFAVVGEFTRGRIDKPFRVDKSRIKTWLGKPKSMRAFAPAEALTQIVEGCQNGAAGVVVSRLFSDDAKLKWIIVNNDNSEPLKVSSSDSKPTVGDYPNMAFAFRLKNAINEGVIVELEKLENGQFNVIVREYLGLDTASASIGGYSGPPQPF